MYRRCGTVLDSPRRRVGTPGLEHHRIDIVRRNRSGPEFLGDFFEFYVRVIRVDEEIRQAMTFGLSVLLRQSPYKQRDEVY